MTQIELKDLTVIQISFIDLNEKICKFNLVVILHHNFASRQQLIELFHKQNFLMQTLKIL